MKLINKRSKLKLWKQFEIRVKEIKYIYHLYLSFLLQQKEKAIILLGNNRNGQISVVGC